MNDSPSDSDGDVVTFLAGALHDLKSPLAVVLGFSELAQREIDAEHYSELAEMLPVILRNGHRISTIIDEMLSLTDPEAAVEWHPRDHVELDRLLANAAAIARSADHGVTISCPSDLRVWTEAWRLEQILMTLIDNSCRHGTPPVEVTGGRRGDDIVISITDQGAGIGADGEPDLFVAFTPLSSREDGVHGLGLFAAHRNAKQLGGSLSYVADPETERWAFEVKVPAIPPPDAP